MYNLSFCSFICLIAAITTDALYFVQVKVGDTLDLVLSENQAENTVTLMRVVLRKVYAETSTTDKYKVVVRRWKSLELTKDEAL